MKQSAVEWLYERLERMIPRTALYNIDKKEYFEQSKEMEKQQQDDFTIGFAEWCCIKYTKLHSVWCPIFGDQRDKNNWKTTKELLEIYKKEKLL